jgi:hypothetical protein
LLSHLLQLNVDPNNRSALMSALSALLGPDRFDKAKEAVRKPSRSSRKSLALTNTTLFLVDKNENFEWRANIAALDDVFVDPSRPPVKGENIHEKIFFQTCHKTYLAHTNLTSMFGLSETSYGEIPLRIDSCKKLLLLCVSAY